MFWENFSRICNERETTVSAACIAAGMTKNRPYNWKNGSLPKQDEMEALAKVLDCTVADFFSEGPVKVTGDGVRLSQYESAMLDIFNELDPIDQADVMVYARNLRDRKARELSDRYGA